MSNDQEQNTNAVPPIPGDPAADAAARLSGQGGPEQQHQDTHRGDEPPMPEVPLPIDINALSDDQLHLLKARLNATPDRVSQKRSNPTVLIRRFNGNYVTDIGGAIDSLVRNEDGIGTKELVLIPIKTLGSDEWVKVNWKEFMQSEQIRCEVIKMESVPESIPERGTVFSREKGVMVQREITTVRNTLTIQLPAGAPEKTMTVDAKIANA